MGYRLSNSASRKLLLENELKRIVAILKREDISKIILFGSMCGENIGSTSDIDLVVVQKTQKRFLQRIDDLIQLIRPRCATDILVYTPEEFEQLQLTNSFIGQITSQGKVLYENERI
jgi:predicted nucleotidyltransferase